LKQRAALRLQHVTRDTKEQKKKLGTGTNYPSILFLNFHPNLLRISMAVISNCLELSFKMALSSSLDRIDLHLIQNVPLKITCKGKLVIELLKITSFRLMQIAQQLLQEPNKSATQAGE